MAYIKKLSGKEFLNGFFEVSKKVYADDTYWVCPLKFERGHFFNPKNNPFFKHAELEFFGCFENDKIVGTVIPFIDKAYNSYHQEMAVHFGFFECINNFEIAKKLFAVVEKFAQEKKANLIRGPFNFSTNHECGLLVDGFDSSPVILMTYNPVYYVKFFKDYNLVKAKDLVAYKVEAKPVSPQLEEVVKTIRQQNEVQIRKMRKKEINTLVPLMMEIYNDAWSKNWGFVPMDEEEFKFISGGLKLFLDEDLSFVLENKNTKEAIGFSITLPDYNTPLKEMKGNIFPDGWIKFLSARKKINLARIFALGIKKGFHDKNFAALLYLETWKAILAKGYKFAEMSWILEDNLKMRRAIEMAGGVVYKTYRIYEKAV